MIQLLLLIILVCVCAVIYLLGDRDPLAPAFLFALGFAACAFSAVCFSSRWAYEMSPEMFFVILSGVLMFAVVAYFCQSFKIKPRTKRKKRASRHWELPVNRGLLFAFLVLEGGVLCWSLWEIVNTFPAESMSRSIGLYNTAVKFTDEGADIFKTPLSQLRSFCSMVGYVFAFYVAQSFALKKRFGRTVQICGLLVACLLQLASANRTIAVGYIFCSLIAYFVIKRKLNHDRPVIGMRTTLALVAVVLCFIVSFQTVAEVLQGRSTSSDALGYLSAYIGAQFPNLDTFIHAQDGYGNSGVFGYMTFRNSIRWIGLQFGISEFVYQYDLPFNSINGVSTGNVYTTFYAFLYDFGFAGCIVLTGIMAAISQIVYKKSRALESGSLSGFWIIIYTMIAYALVLCFFSNKFYENILTIGMIYKVIYLLIIFWLINVVAKRKKRAISVGRRDPWRA